MTSTGRTGHRCDLPHFRTTAVNDLIKKWQKNHKFDSTSALWDIGDTPLSLPGMQRGVHWRISIQSHII